MAKFNIGDKLECIYQGMGFEKATVLKIYKEKKGKNKGREMYLFGITNGTATVPVSVEDKYKLKKT